MKGRGERSGKGRLNSMERLWEGGEREERKNRGKDAHED